MSSPALSTLHKVVSHRCMVLLTKGIATLTKKVLPGRCTGIRFVGSTLQCV